MTIWWKNETAIIFSTAYFLPASSTKTSVDSRAHFTQAASNEVLQMIQDAFKRVTGTATIHFEISTNEILNEISLRQLWVEARSRLYDDMERFSARLLAKIEGLGKNYPIMLKEQMERCLEKFLTGSLACSLILGCLLPRCPEAAGTGEIALKEWKSILRNDTLRPVFEGAVRRILPPVVCRKRFRRNDRGRNRPRCGGASESERLFAADHRVFGLDGRLRSADQKLKASEGTSELASCTRFRSCLGFFRNRGRHDAYGTGAGRYR